MPGVRSVAVCQAVSGCVSCKAAFTRDHIRQQLSVSSCRPLLDVLGPMDVSWSAVGFVMMGMCAASRSGCTATTALRHQLLAKALCPLGGLGAGGWCNTDSRQEGRQNAV